MSDENTNPENTLDPAGWMDMAEQVSIPWNPYFYAVHCLLSCVAIRDDLGAKALPFSRKHPLATWLACMVAVFAGGLLCAPLLGEPILSAIDSNEMILMGTISWYLVFYSPFDLGSTVCKILPIKIALYVMKEIHRVKKVSSGVALAAKHYPNNYIIMLIIGTLKGNGAGFMKVISRLCTGIWTPDAIEVLAPSFPTKACMVAAIMFILKTNTHLISVPNTVICVVIGSFYVYSKLAYIFAIHAPFIPCETAVCNVVFGGIEDESEPASTEGESEPASEKSEESKKND